MNLLSLKAQNNSDVFYYYQGEKIFLQKCQNKILIYSLTNKNNLNTFNLHYISMVVDGELRLLAPNPADNQVRIGYALSRNVSSATLQILNGSGQVIYSQSLSGGSGSKVTGETLVNTSSLAAGSYTVRLISSRGNIFDSKTLIIQ